MLGRVKNGDGKIEYWCACPRFCKGTRRLLGHTTYYQHRRAELGRLESEERGSTAGAPSTGGPSRRRQQPTQTGAAADNGHGG